MKQICKNLQAWNIHIWKEETIIYHLKKFPALPKLAILSELDLKKQGRKMRPRPALHHFQRFLQKRYGPTDGPTDGHTLL